MATMAKDCPRQNQEPRVASGSLAWLTVAQALGLLSTSVPGTFSDSYVGNGAAGTQVGASDMVWQQLSC